MEFGELNGQRVVLKPLEPFHAEELYACSRSGELWKYLPIHIKTLKEMTAFVHKALEARDRGEEFPFVVMDKSNSRIIGTTRYLRISQLHRNLNIGWIWYSEQVWRTGVNTECKYLLLKHAFQSWGAVRVEIITTIDHEKSQRAIQRLGATKEGVLRKKYNNKDYVIYSIVDEEWPEVKNQLERRLVKGE